MGDRVVLVRGPGMSLKRSVDPLSGEGKILRFCHRLHSTLPQIAGRMSTWSFARGCGPHCCAPHTRRSCRAVDTKGRVTRWPQAAHSCRAQALRQPLPGSRQARVRCATLARVCLPIAASVGTHERTALRPCFGTQTIGVVAFAAGTSDTVGRRAMTTTAVKCVDQGQGRTAVPGSRNCEVEGSIEFLWGRAV